MEKKESKMSDVEWGLLIGGVFMIEIMQAILEWALVGIVINPIITFFIALGIPLYLHLRGENMADKKRVIGLITSAVMEMIPLVEELPTWTVYLVSLYIQSRSQKILGKAPKNKPQATGATDSNGVEKAA